MLLAALAGIAVLWTMGALLEPPRIALGEAPAHEGARVSVEGRVLDAHGARLVIADARHRVLAFAPAGAAAAGDVVRGAGVVQRVDGAWAIDLDRIDVIERAASRAVSPADLAREPGSFVGARVLVRGEAREDVLVGGGARLRVLGEPAPELGVWWLADGVFEYRAGDAAYALRVSVWNRPS